jgi:Holliday junction resolvasome RuvABC endonuclease subunit
MERNKRTKSINILAFDPSITAFGWAVMCNNQVVACGCIKTAPSEKKLRIRKGDDRTRRITEINTILIKIIEDNDIKLIVSELPHGSQSAVAATALGMVTGQVQTLADAFSIGIEWYSEADSKKNALGKKAAEKQEMIKKMKSIYEVPWTGIKYKDEAIADAIAIYHVAKNHSTIIRYIF